VKARLVPARHAEQLADHGNWQRVCEVVDDIDLAVAAVRIEQAREERDDAVVHARDPLGGEQVHHQAAQPVVIWRVAEDEGRVVEPARG
jgi:hypothetical protein